jgi:hypothetical protein
MATIHILTIRKPTECFGGRPCCRSAGRIGCALTHWLAPVFGEGLLLSADIDKIEALSADRTALWERVSKAPFLSVNEKRLAAGYGPIDGKDMFLRQYGAMLVKDHGDHKAKAVQVANEFGVTPPTGSGIGAKATYAKLKMLSDASFEKSFAKAMVNDHQEDIKEYRQGANKNDAAGRLAKEALPVLQKAFAGSTISSRSRLHRSNLCVEVGSTNHSSRSG